ncbi:hypothetical protein F5Y12DRAFT_713323 [Xylaria sp. FL1777]|nr:hypothetical protein F5Y12DRAFT_713323 [Xylaria sp. FL1777]
MTDTISRTTPRQTVSDHGLSRSFTNVVRKHTQFMEPYIESLGNAEFFGFRISLELDIYDWYLVSPLLNSYITLYVDLTDGDGVGAKRRTPMRYRDMMVDNYLAAGGDLRTWRFIGTRSIINDPTRFLIEKSFFARGRDSRKPGSIEFLASDEKFVSITRGNPFTRCIQGLLSQYEKDMGKAKMKRVIFITEGWAGDISYGYPEPKFHLVVELYRPGDDGYPNN